jgi:hypothetical protein
MRNQILSSIIFSAIIFTITSCSVYTPNALNIPLLKEKGEFEVAAHVGNGTNLQAVYAVSNCIGLMANYMGTDSEVTINENLVIRKGSMYEIGCGYFSKRPASKALFEIYGGVGFGNINLDRTLLNAPSDINFQSNITKLFIQPAIGSVGKNFEISFATRLTFAQFRKINTNYSREVLLEDKLDNLEQPSWMFIEPALTLRLGIQNVKLQMQIGRSIKLNKQEIEHRSSIFNCGVIARI